MVQATGQLNQLYVSVNEARLMLGIEAASTAPASLDLPENPPAANLADAPPLGDDPLGRLARRFKLDRRQARLLFAAAAPLLSVDLARLYGFAWADFAVKVPTVGFLTELVADSDAEALDLQDEFAPLAALVRYRLVELTDAGPWGKPGPRLHRGALVPEAVLAQLRGAVQGLPPELIAFCHHQPAAEALAVEGVFAEQTTMSQLRTACAAGRDPARLMLAGPPGIGRRAAFAAVVAERGLGTLTVDMAGLDPNPARFEAQLAEAAREALLRDAALLLRGDTLIEDRERWAPLAPIVARMVNAHDGPVAFSARLPTATLQRAVERLFDIAMRHPTTPEQRGLWAQALEGGHAGDVALAPALSGRFSVTPGTMTASVHEARSRRLLAGGEGPLTEPEVSRAVRRRLQHALSQVAEPFTTSLEWDDVVLPAEVQQAMDDILARARHREQVYDRWGFRRKMSYGRGLACLFCGPPGTGKTMMAALIGKTLGRELYRVDLSRIVSKWVGETEKNLGRVFDEAEKAQVILLFDEADSLFSSRTEVKGSNDRHANMEINYLLQRMEQYDGMSLLTTNFEKSIDDAFKRRLKFKVDFPLPDADDRTRLWAAMLPEEADVQLDKIRFEVLGKKFKISGGNIKNAVLRAAFYAAEAGTPITHKLLEKAAVAEAREMGRLI